MSKALGLGDTFAGTLCQVGLLGQLGEPSPTSGETFAEALGGLGLPAVHIVGVISIADFVQDLARSGLPFLRPVVPAFGLHERREGAPEAFRERRGTTPDEEQGYFL